MKEIIKDIVIKRNPLTDNFLPVILNSIPPMHRLVKILHRFEEELFKETIFTVQLERLIDSKEQYLLWDI